MRIYCKRWLVSQIPTMSREDAEIERSCDGVKIPAVWQPVVVDLDAIEVFRPQMIDDEQTTQLWLSGGHELIVRMPFDHFYDLHKAYRSGLDAERGHEGATNGP